MSFNRKQEMAYANPKAAIMPIASIPPFSRKSSQPIIDPDEYFNTSTAPTRKRATNNFNKHSILHSPSFEFSQKKDIDKELSILQQNEGFVNILTD